jgi:hypothetical protein
MTARHHSTLASLEGHVEVILVLLQFWLWASSGPESSHSGVELDGVGAGSFES